MSNSNLMQVDSDIFDTDVQSVSAADELPGPSTGLCADRLEQMRLYSQEHSQELHARKCQHRQDNRDAVNASQREYIAENRDQVNSNQRAYRDQNRDNLNSSQREYIDRRIASLWIVLGEIWIHCNLFSLRE